MKVKAALARTKLSIHPRLGEEAMQSNVVQKEVGKTCMHRGYFCHSPSKFDITYNFSSIAPEKMQLDSIINFE